MAQTSLIKEPYPTDLDLTLIRLEYARIDLLVERQVRRWRSAGQEIDDVYRGLYISEAEIDALLDRPLASGWGQWITDTTAETVEYNQTLQKILMGIKHVETQAQKEGFLLRLRHLERVFGLDAFEKDAFLIALAPLIDLRYERLFGYLQDDVTRKKATLNLMLNLLCPPGPERYQRLIKFLDEAPLVKNCLVHWSKENFEKDGVLNRPLGVDEPVYTWLVGQYQPSSSLSPLIKRIKPGQLVEDWSVPEDLLGSLASIQTGRPVVVFTGVDETRKLSAFNAIANQVNKPIFCLNICGSSEDSVSIQASLIELMRDCRLNDAIPAIASWDFCLEDEHPFPVIFDEVLTFPDIVIISGTRSWVPGGIGRNRNIAWFDFSIPNYKERLKFWAFYVNEQAIFSTPDFQNLASQFLLTSGQICDAVASAKDEAAQKGECLNLDGLFIAAREHSNPRLAGLARKIRTEFDWNDLVLPEDSLELLKEILNTVKARPLVLDDWGVGRKLAPNRGVTVLFAGPPGTGKTMSAGILAWELGLDLYKIDLSTVVSKYIGETEKNLERIFIEAETSNSILFFDEADALFGKRSEVKDAHDRYANIEISFLLQRMEAYNGVTILATNMRANLDEAFTRRLQFAVDFPFPDEPYRLQIWKTIFPPGIPRSDDIDFQLLARRFRLAGGNIRNIIVNAAYLAASDGGCVHMSHILHGTRRELQKMGRLTSETDFL